MYSGIAPHDGSRLGLTPQKERMNINLLTPGTEVFWCRYGAQISTGKVLAVKHSSHSPKVCVEMSDSFETVEPEELFTNQKDAVLYRAVELQQEASSKLSAAARMFRDVGVMATRDED